ncbi:MAG: energy transducer TonB [Bacteroidota bacterium]|nr:energy transducer TonB [Bacteroidota bacterium]
MNEATERKHQRISGIITSVISILLLLFMWFYTFNMELPDLSEDGAVAVSYGDPDAGGPSEVPVEAESAPAPSQPQVDEAVEQTNDPDAVATKQTKETKKKTETKETPKETPKEEPKDDALDQLLKGKKSQTKTNSGDGTKTGTQGDPKGTGDNNTGGDGTGTSKTGSGSTGSGGFSHSFGSRTFRAGKTNINCGRAGKVVLEVSLKPDGTIIYEGVSPKSNANTCLEDAARDILKRSSFAPSSNPINVNGEITFIFQLN